MNPVFLLIEFLDELVFGVTETAWPLIRDDLGLSYAQIGLALSLPGFLSTFTEPFIGILGDVWKRRVMILGGGLMFLAALLMMANALSFSILLLALIVFYPSSGAFVSLSQASLMDADPSRHEQNMARWTLAGSIGVVAGPLLLAAAATVAIGWRGVYVGLAAVTLALLLLIWRKRKGIVAVSNTGERLSLLLVWQGLRDALKSLKRKDVLRWLVLLEFSDLMLDILHAFLALYLVDVAGLTGAQAALAIGAWTAIRLLGDLLLIPLLERIQGLRYLRVSVLAIASLYPIFLLWDDLLGKMIVISLIGFLTAGWYAILKGQLYSALPGQSGAVMALSNVVGMIGDLLPLGIGLAAHFFGLANAMWLLMLGPLVLLAGLPKYAPER